MSSFGDTRFPVARKDYRCEWCGQPIPVGEKHAHFVGKWEGEFQNWRMHSECLSANERDIAEGFQPHDGERPVIETEDHSAQRSER